MGRIDLTALEPQRVLEDPLKYGIMVYGESGSGKSSLIAQAPRTLIIDTEDGALAIAGIMRQPVYSWSEFLQVLNQLRKKEVKDMFDIIAIDTIDSLAFMLEQHILQVNNIESMSDLHFSAAYSQAKKALKKAFNTIRTLGYSLLIAGHNKKAVDDDNQKIKYQDLAMPNYIAQIVKKEMSAILYIESNRYGDRAVHYFMDADYYAKCRFKYAEPTTEFSFEAIYNNLKASIEKEQEVSGIYGNNDKAEQSIGSGQQYGDTEVSEEDFIEPDGWEDYQKMKDLCQKGAEELVNRRGPMILDDVKLIVENNLGSKKVVDAEATDLEALRNIYRGMFKLSLN